MSVLKDEKKPTWGTDRERTDKLNMEIAKACAVFAMLVCHAADMYDEPRETAMRVAINGLIYQHSYNTDSPAKYDKPEVADYSWVDEFEL